MKRLNKKNNKDNTKNKEQIKIKLEVYKIKEKFSFIIKYLETVKLQSQNNLAGTYQVHK